MTQLQPLQRNANLIECPKESRNPVFTHVTHQPTESGFRPARSGFRPHPQLLRAEGGTQPCL
jgi:hypothetical protein